MIKVKICGITNLEDALLASNLGADALGFIFSKKSPRYLSETAAKKIIAQLDPFLIKVGVFIDQDQKTVYDIASALNLDVLQFHGSELARYCRFFAKEFKIIKVFFPKNTTDLNEISRYKVDASMFDVRYEQKKRGNSSLSESILKGIARLIKNGERVIISGGLNVSNLLRVKKFKPYALDVASGIEKLVGKKDKQLLKEFIERVKK